MGAASHKRTRRKVKPDAAPDLAHAWRRSLSVTEGDARKAERLFVKNTAPNLRERFGPHAKVVAKVLAFIARAVHASPKPAATFAALLGHMRAEIAHRKASATAS
jgi:hypothetical protein